MSKRPALPAPVGPAPPSSRRQFLRVAAAAVAALRLSRAAICRGQSPPERLLPAAGAKSTSQARVVKVASDKMIPVRVVQKTVLKDALEKGVCALAGEKRADDAWHRILRPDDTVLLKFNQSGADLLGTTPPLARALLGSLRSAGWGPDRILVLEARGDDLAILRETKPPDLRWQGRQVRFGSCGQDSLLAALDQATAIINVPFLKTHHMATMTSCLKNLSHGLVRHPARFHAGGCDPAIGEIVACEPIRSRLRLNIVNAMRVVFDRGPAARATDIHKAGTLLFSTDAVAGDAVGFALLNEVRSLHEMNPLLPGAGLPRQILTAARLGLGQADSDKIQQVLIEL